MNALTSDFEITTFNKGSPFDSRNKAVCLGVKDNDEAADCWFDILSYPQKNYITVPDGAWDLYVFFNAKFDLHWYRRLGVDISNWKIWCCQVAEFVLEGQKNAYPSLETTAVKYGLGHKIDTIKLEYWDKGINTDMVPQDILSDYCKQDVELTYKVYQHQLEQFKQKPALFQLFKLMCQDLLVLEEMEWNGLKYNETLCQQRSTEIEKELDKIYSKLATIYPDVPINFNSGDQLSAFLYGGEIPRQVKEHVGFFKNGNPKYKLVDKSYVLPRLIEPLKKTGLLKEGYYKTDENTLRKLRGPAAKRFVGPLLRLAELEKLNGTYYKGIPEKNKEGYWPEGMIHGQFNQCVAQTGRLSSSKPNLQNFAGDCQDILVSRYG
jgi:DNA polymerase I-like protein with 3'-5' exonuclease and polymerase domains